MGAEEMEKQGELKLSPMEIKALELIIKAGEQGLLQQDLWKLLGIDSREGSRITLKLLKKKLIHREPVVVRGRRTYLLRALVKSIPKEGEEIQSARIPKPVNLDLKVKLDTVIEIPCFTCPYLETCGVGQLRDPTKCPKLTMWLMRKVRPVRRRVRAVPSQVP